jgi:hypothetical protein
MSTQIYSTQVLTHIVWGDADCAEVVRLKAFGWKPVETSYKRTVERTEVVTVLLRVCSYSDVETLSGGPAFVRLTDQ